ncbi:hypothetical protein DL93DRAFT_2060213 [Clavulina sp. PMI_390]|nr:hypothetical protein DL93DRAFT_2060213 [Clavulina sp. PMI_390]
MAYLARRPGTWFWRLAIAPVAFVATIRTAFGYQWTDPMFNAYNFGSGLAGVCGAAKVLELACYPNGLLKVGEREPGVIENPAIELEQLNQEIHLRRGTGISPSEVAQERGSRRNPIAAGFLDAIEALTTMRGIGWQFGTGTDIYVPPETRDTTNKARFWRQTFASFLVYFVLFDVVTSAIQLVPGIGTPDGGSIFAFGGDNLLKKYAISVAIEFSTGVAFILGFEMVYRLVTLIILPIPAFKQEPSFWPPLFDKPWASVSLHEFWSKRWHQLLRQTFLVMGGYPLAFALSLVAMLLGFLLGTFTASGLFHYWALYGMGRGTDVQCLIFFAAQAVGVMLERVWKAVTGRRVGGWLGRAWVWIWVVGGIQWCINAWHERGFAGGMLVPPIVSPARFVVFPLVQPVFDALGVPVTLPLALNA